MRPIGVLYRVPMGKIALVFGKELALDAPLNLELLNVAFFETDEGAGYRVDRYLVAVNELPELVLADVEHLRRFFHGEEHLFR